LCGALQPLPSLIEMLEPLRKDRDLHLTLIRNEAAYYATIGQLVRRLEQFPIPDAKPLVVCGDSHCLSTAWRVINFKSTMRLLVPYLATGVQIWHMRKESSFYPSKNFDAALQSIPNGSECIFIFGEIDCRTSLINAVEKCKYDSMEQAQNVLIDIYIKRLTELTKYKQLTIYVHPIPPVLDVTRPVVLQFNNALRQRLSKDSRLRWLEFENDLLTSNRSALSEEYNLDKTHLDSSYVKLIERELNKA